MLLFKTPWYTYGKYRTGNPITASEILKSTLLGYTPQTQTEVTDTHEKKLLLAQNVPLEHLAQQNQIDEKVEEERTSQLSLSECQAEIFSKEELEKYKQKASGGALSEDF